MQARQGSLVRAWSEVQILDPGVNLTCNPPVRRVLLSLGTVSTGKSLLGRGREARTWLFVRWMRKFTGGVMKEASTFM